MAKICLSHPPVISGKPHKDKYRSWLEDNFYKNLCSYCLVYNESLEVEHYVPTAYRKDLEHSPSNLLLSCRKCNGNKNDYHPNFTERRTQKTYDNGFAVIDIREEDFEGLFGINSNTGDVYPLKGSAQDRVAWNIAILLDLNRRSLLDRRTKLIGFLECVKAMIKGQETGTVDNGIVKMCFDTLLPLIADNELFYHCFGIEIPEKVHDRLVPYQSKRCTSLPQ